MKIAISATGNTLDSDVDLRFGRCSWFIVVETDDMSFEAIQNENADLPNGAGIQSASQVASLGVQAVLTGSCGPKATQALSTTDINIYLGCGGTVRQAVDQFKADGGRAAPASSSEVARPVNPGQGGTPQPDMGGGGGRGMGGGGGRGMGGGGGRGMGGGGGRGMGGGGGRGMGGGGGTGSR